MSNRYPVNPQKRLLESGTVPNDVMTCANPVAGQIPVFDGANWIPTNQSDIVSSSSGSGTVTSVDMTLPKEFTSPVSGAPITTSGTLAVSWANEGANTVFAGPSTGSPGVPGFRSLVVGDLPTIISGSATQVAVCDGAGGASGSSYFTFDTSTKLLIVKGSAGGATLIANDANSAFGDSDGYVRGMGFWASQSSAQCYWGDANSYANGTSVFLDDDAMKLWVGQSGGETVVIDLANSKTTSNVKHEASGDIKLMVAGNGYYVKEGSNATMGTATLVAGTATVSTTKVTASSRIQLTVQSLGTVAVPKAIAVTARTAGTSFTITSADATDTSVVAWLIVEPS